MLNYGKHSIRPKDIEAVAEALKSDRITQGPLIEQFEDALCDYFECDHAVVVSNGTLALHLVYKALGVSEGDQVITSPNTFLATANGILYNDGTPRFIDIDPETYNLSVNQLEKYLHSKSPESPSKTNQSTRPRSSLPEGEDSGGADSQKLRSTVGIAPVHFAGRPCNMESIKQLADQNDLFVLEDACHAPGAKWKDSQGNWQKVGSCSHSDASILSFHPVKHFTTGEGGAVLTNRPEVADSVRRLRTHGITKDPDRLTENHGPWYYEMQELGHNGRITDFQCALGLTQLEDLDKNVRKRRDIARQYDQAFSDLPEVQTPATSPQIKHAYHLYVIRAQKRDQLFNHLQENEIQPQVHYIPVHRQPYYRENFDYKQGDFPNAEDYYREAITLPLYPTLAEDEVNHVINTVKAFYRNDGGR